MFLRVQKALAGYSNVVLLLPSPDIEESVRITKMIGLLKAGKKQG